MKTLILIVLFISSLSQSVLADSPAGGITEPLPTYSTGYDPQRDPFADGYAAIKLATKSQRRILIEVGGNWCSWCHRLDYFLEQNPDIKARLQQTFVMLKVNVSEENDNHKFLSVFPKPLGYPHMYVSDSDGSVLWSKDTGEFLVNGQYARQKFIEFFDRWQKKPQTNQKKANRKQTGKRL